MTAQHAAFWLWLIVWPVLGWRYAGRWFLGDATKPSVGDRWVALFLGLLTALFWPLVSAVRLVYILVPIHRLKGPGEVAATEATERRRLVELAKKYDLDIPEGWER